jgi:hypothetical protein
MVPAVPTCKNTMCPQRLTRQNLQSVEGCGNLKFCGFLRNIECWSGTKVSYVTRELRELFKYSVLMVSYISEVISEVENIIDVCSHMRDVQL